MSSWIRLLALAGAVAALPLGTMACDSGSSHAGAAARAVLALAGNAMGVGTDEDGQARAGGEPSGGSGGETSPGLARAATAPDSGDDTEERVYYRYTDESGSVRFVRSLAEVPAGARAESERIEVAQPRSVAGTSEPRAARKPGRRAWSETLAAPGSRSGSSSQVVVYSAPWCGWCRKTLAWLDRRGVDYDNRDIDANPEYKRELVAKTGRTSIPVVEIDGQLIRGYDASAMERLL